jgi:hypothetical protein
MKKFIIAINYTVYRFYKSRGNSDPIEYSSTVPALMVLLNIYTLVMLSGLHLVFSLSSKKSKFIIAILCLTLIFLNYLVVYWKSNYNNLFFKFGGEESNKPVIKTASNYILISIALFFLSLIWVICRHIWGF